jgi:hypothetical protein
MAKEPKVISETKIIVTGKSHSVRQFVESHWKLPGLSQILKNCWF